jgi:hypothetical protein
MKFFTALALSDPLHLVDILVRPKSATFNVAYCATEWIGMAGGTGIEGHGR